MQSKTSSIYGDSYMTSDREITAWVFGCTDVGLVRTNNEDAYVIADLSGQTVASVPPDGVMITQSDGTLRADEGLLKKCRVGDKGLLLAVSDGMGGAEAGEIASFLVVESIREGLTSPKDHGTGRLVRSAVEKANSVVYNAASENPQRSTMGATLSAVFVREDRAYVAGVGDSRCYLIRGRRIRQVTRDQSLVESLVELGHLTREEAETSPHKNIILQALGTRQEVAVALTRLELHRGDLILLCSDGLSGKVGDEEMLEFALGGPTIDEAGRRLVKLAKERGGDDNITVILAHLSGPGLQSPDEQTGVTGTLKKIHGFNHAAGTGYDDDAMDTLPEWGAKEFETAKLAPLAPEELNLPPAEAEDKGTDSGGE